MAVHAHPDDEASSTGGLLARCADEGIRTILVTCTNGELGDGPGGVKPGEPGHVGAEVATTRLAELEASCSILGVSKLELLGFHDSGMIGWPQNDAPGCFWRTPVAEGAARLASLIEDYRPQVVVTYDANGFYGHPDHIQAHRITTEAVRSTGIPDKLYYPTFPRSAVQGFAAMLQSAGMEPPEDLDPETFGTPDDEVSAVIDCVGAVERQYDALAAHASQGDNVFFLRLGRDFFAGMFGREHFVRAFDRTGHPLPEDDLFAGLR